MHTITLEDGWKRRVLGDDEWHVAMVPDDAMLEAPRSATSPNGTAGAFFDGQAIEYRRMVHVPDEWRGHAVMLEFEGVYKDATILLNGQRVAFHAYGYTGFVVELTDHLVYGADNELTVIADNSKMPNSRWYTGTGIYRPVLLHVAPLSHIALHGVRIATVSTQPARVRVVTQIEGPSSSQDDISIAILDAKGVEVAHGNGADATIEVGAARLWSAEDPYMYTCVVRLERDGEMIDETCESIGIRMIEWSRRGLFVNGRSVKLRGGCVHHDNGVIGARALEEAEWRRVRIMKEQGFNAIRSAHNPASQALKRACDAYGIYLIDEMWDMWYERKNRYDNGLNFEANWREDLTAMIKGDYNHPSIIMYSIGNENMEPYCERGVSTARELTEEIHGLDNSRPVTIGCNILLLMMAAAGIGLYHEDSGQFAVDQNDAQTDGSTQFNESMSLSSESVQAQAANEMADALSSPVLDTVDVAGYNYGAIRYDKEGELHPDRLIYGSETMPFDIARNWRQVMSHDYIVGDFMWTAWDYLGEVGIGSWSDREDAGNFQKPYPWLLGEAGVINIIGVPDASAAYAGVVWGKRTDPYIGVRPPRPAGTKLHRGGWRGTDAIDSWSWSGHEGEPTVVEVYAHDGVAVELMANGRKLGMKPLDEYRAMFDVAYEPGVLEARVLDADGHELSHTSLTSAQADLHLTLNPEPTYTGDGSVVFVDVALVDVDGVVESSDDRTIQVQVEGGELIGFGSAQPVTEQRFDSGTYDTYRGRALAVVRMRDGETTVTATDLSSGRIASCALGAQRHDDGK